LAGLTPGPAFFFPLMVTSRRTGAGGRGPYPTSRECYRLEVPTFILSRVRIRAPRQMCRTGYLPCDPNRRKSLADCRRCVEDAALLVHGPMKNPQLIRAGAILSNSRHPRSHCRVGSGPSGTGNW
jgi:hypothetical protein